MVRPVRHCRSGVASSESADSGSATECSPSQHDGLVQTSFPAKHHADDKVCSTVAALKLKPRHPCSVCGQLFALRSTWHEHMREAHGITKPFDCDECGKRYSMLGALNYHRLTTHRGVVHACKTCGKRFMTKPGLVRHAKSHFGGVYVCEDCEKTYPTRDSLRRHRQQVHMGDKPHVCQICQERFGASHSLNRHVKRRHSSRAAGESAAVVSGEHTCHLCHKPFLSAEALRKHVQSMHRHAQYQCETCLRRFYDLSNYSRHRDARTCTPAVSVDLSSLESPQLVHKEAAISEAAVVALPLVLQQLAPVVAAAVEDVTGATAAGQAAPLVVSQVAAPAEIELSAEENSEFASVVAVKVEQEVQPAEEEDDDGFAEFARQYGEGEPPVSVPVGSEDTVELQPVDAAELRALEAGPVCGEGQVLVPLTLAQPLVAPISAAGGQDVYVTLYPAGETAGHRFVCVQDGDSTVFAEAPLITEQMLDCN